MAKLVINFILLLLVLVSMVFVYTLFGFHIYLTIKNETTNEFCKESWETALGNPFRKYAPL